MAMIAIVGLGTACGASDSGDVSRPRLRVFAAASLTETVGAIANAFERSHPGVDVDLSFAGSSSLVEQLRRGADADVLLTADRQTMERARDAGAVGDDATVIARNRLTLVVEKGNPTGIDDLRDLSRRDLLVVLCAPAVPCGALARLLLDTANVEVEPASLEENVKGVVAKVAIGEADAGLVYETDANVARDDVETIPVPLAADRRFEAVYPAAIVRSTGERDLAEAFVAHLISPPSQTALRDAGFRAP